MLRWAGHRAVAVLDGGLAAWKAAGHAVSTEAPPARPPGRFALREPLVTTLSYEEVRANIEGGNKLVLDARAPDRFRGENETMDPVGGHIPGARNRLFKDNLDADGRFKPARQLRAEFDAITGGRPAAELVNQCGSGVTACHNLLAMEVAGLKGAALYPGSWSEWSAQPGAPIATGPAA
jgi:thiosulfate/3-mercaptopyruvate sulfurtransferase